MRGRERVCARERARVCLCVKQFHVQHKAQTKQTDEKVLHLVRHVVEPRRRNIAHER